MAAPVGEVLYIVPSYLTDSQKKNIQCVKVVRPSTELFSAPLETGLESLRMGPKNSHQICHTCLNPNLPGGCTLGHEGWIEVPCYINYPIVNIMLRIWNAICLFCHNWNAETHQILNCMEYFKKHYNPKGINKLLDVLLESFEPIIAKRRPDCMHCKNAMPYYTLDKNIKNILYRKIGEHSVANIMSPTDLCELHSMLTRSPLIATLPNEMHNLLSQCFHTTILVPPNQLRPEIINHTNKIQTHPFTVALQTIMGFKNKIKEAENYDNAADQNNIYCDYNNAIYQYMYGKLQSSTNAPQDPNIQYIGSLSSLGTRNGIIRKNLEGRTSNNVGRCVVLANSTLHPDEFEVTGSFAMNFSIKSMVTKYNQKRLAQYLCNGPYKWCGAIQAFIDGVLYTKVQIAEEGFILAARISANGQDYVKHHLEDGYPVFVNRNPSLLPTNVAGGFIRINDRIASIHAGIGMSDNKLKHGYSGDADGDNVLVVVPTTAAGIMDVLKLLSLERIGRSEKNEKMIYMCTNNAIIAAIITTLNDYSCKLHEAIAIINATSLSAKKRAFYIRSLIKQYHSSENVSMRDLLSLPLPPNLNYTGTCTYGAEVLAPYFKNGPPILQIRNGRILKGSIMDNDGLDCSKPHTIGERLFGCIPTSVIINKFHELRQIGYGILDYVGFSLSVEDMELPPLVLSYLATHEHALLTRTKASLDVHDIITPPEKLSKKITKREALVVQHCTGDPMLGLIVNNLKNGLHNPLLTLSMTKKAHPGDILNLKSKEGIILINGHLPEQGVPYRISPLYPANSNDPCMIGYNGSNTQRGIGILDYFKSTADSQNNLQQRAFNTSESGNMRRRNTYMAAPVVTTSFGHLIFGDFKLKQDLIGVSYGYMNWAPHMTKSPILLSEILSVPYSDVWSNYTTPYGNYNEQFELYKKLRTLISDSFYALGQTGCVDLGCFDRVRLPINIEHMQSVMPQNPNPAANKAEMCDKYDKVVQLVERIETILVSDEWITANNNFCPGYIKLSTIMLRLHILHNLTPMWCFTMSKATIIYYCATIWEQTHRAIVPGYCPAGDLASSTISEQIIQTVLDAPKSKSNVSAIQLSEYQNYVMRRQSPGHTPTIAVVPIINNDLFVNGAKHLVCVYLRDLKQYVSVEIGLVQSKAQYFGPLLYNILTNTNKYIIIEFVIDRDRLTATNCGASEYYILACIIKKTNLFCVMGERTIKSFSILILGDNNLNNPYIDVSCLKYVNEIIDNITISGIENIISAQVTQRKTLAHNEDGVYIPATQSILTIVTMGLGPLLKIEGIDHSRITFQNPSVHAYYFGILPVRRKLPWMITGLFPEQNVTSGHVLSETMLFTGEHCPLTEHSAKKLWSLNKFILATIFDAKNNLLNMPLHDKYITIGDRISQLYHGMLTKTGSNAGYVHIHNT